MFILNVTGRGVELRHEWFETTVTPMLRVAHRDFTQLRQRATMSDDSLTRLEAMLLSLRDQVDSLSDRVEGRLADQQLLLTRLRLDLARVTATVPTRKAFSAEAGGLKLNR